MKKENTMQIIGDIGSCHLGKLSYAKEAIDLATEVGLTSLKFQLFKVMKWNQGIGRDEPAEIDSNGNIELPRKYWSELVEYAKGKIDIFASVFDEDAIQLLHDTDIKKVKLAYNQNFNLKLIKKAKQLGMEIISSGDDDNYPHYADHKLFCIPEYPPNKLVDNYFPEFFETSNYDGFSSHFIGSKTDIDVLLRHDWKIIEKHFSLGLPEDNTPDSMFALAPKELKEWIKEIRQLA